MFTKIGANWYRHSDGYEVRIVDRETITFKDATCEALVGAELPPGWAIIYKTSLRVFRNSEPIEPTSEEKEQILSRMASAMRMFYQVELA